MKEEWIANRLLAALPRKDLYRLLKDLEPVRLRFGQVLYEPGKPIRHVYFPSDALISVLTVVDGHTGLAVVMVGREGMLGIPAALAVKDSPAFAVVQGTGMSLRMTSRQFRIEHGKHGALYRVLNQYIHERIGQISQGAACNRFHPIECRLARWLLMTRDRLRSAEFPLTQQLLADMLGVLRATVTVAASTLQRRKLIEYCRGNIRILDGKGLEAAACECYQVLKVKDGKKMSMKGEEFGVSDERISNPAYLRASVKRKQARSSLTT